MRFLYQAVLGSRISLNALERLFGGDQQSQTRAYALAGAFVRDLLQKYGEAAPGRILARVRDGASFDDAFAGAAGVRVSEAEADFWRRQRSWTTWLPIVTSSAALWLLVTLIALWAIRRRRQKDAEMRTKWEQEEQQDEPGDEDQPR